MLLTPQNFAGHHVAIFDGRELKSTLECSVVACCSYQFLLKSILVGNLLIETDTHMDVKKLTFPQT
jgi:hypothetical protein